MSEYQYVAFRAIDRPLTGKELDFARTQSSRAEITPWSFTNEYHFGDFHGDPVKLLRSGYDVHLHYANFGTRRVMLRCPLALPFPQAIWSQFVDGSRVCWEKDRRGPGGILSVSPFLEPGDLEDIFEPAAYVDDLAQLRCELLDGDLRALFVLWLCGMQDGDTSPEEDRLPPLPAGIGEVSSACLELLDFYGLDSLLLAAAGENSLPCPDAVDIDGTINTWVAGLSDSEARGLLGQFLHGDVIQAKAATMTRMRKETNQPTWPVSESQKTLEELQQRTIQLRAERRAREESQRQIAAQKEAARKELARQDRMKQMVKDPQHWLSVAGELVEQRGTANYQEAAEILVDLGEAIGGVEGGELVRAHAAQLAQNYPTLNQMKSSLRKRGLLP